MNITNCRHPSLISSDLMERYRLILKGGDDFIKKYLYYLSTLEDYTEYIDRAKNAFNPNALKSVIYNYINPIIDNIYSAIRISKINSYNEALNGSNGGIDNLGNSIQYFMVNNVLEELVYMGSVGVYVDNFNTVIKSNTHPYVYIYRLEDILSWKYDLTNKKLISVLLKNTKYSTNEFGLDDDVVIEYIHLFINNDGNVTYNIYDINNKLIDVGIIELPFIPFRIFSLKKSLITDVDKHQIALLNINSSDLNYVIKANFPFYTEMYDPAFELTNVKRLDDEGNEIDTDKIKVGPTKGRKYKKNLERPQFIHPSSEPLKASLEKQKLIKEEIKEIIENNIIVNGKDKENDIKSGLLVIVSLLESCERFIAETWAAYEQQETKNINIVYSKDFRTYKEEDIIKRCKELIEIMKDIPSLEVKKAILIRISDLLIKNNISQEEFIKIEEEIRALKIFEMSAETIKNDHEAGFVSTETASELRGYDIGEVEQAKKDHAERLARIAAAQTSPGIRGVDDTFENPKQNMSNEKKIQQQVDNKDIPEDQTRGKGK